MTDSGNLFSDLPDDLPEERFETLLQSKHSRLERIISRGHATPPGAWYDQDQDEWVALLAGRACLRFADDEALLNLRPGDYVWIPAHRRHRVEWTSNDEPAVWLALHLTVEPD